MKLFFILAITLLSTPVDAQEAAQCGLRAAMNCSTTNVLMWAPGTLTALRNFLRGESGNFLYDGPKVSAYSDAIEVLGGPPDEPQRLSDGLFLFTACRLHSCTEKGAVILDVEGRILAVGILNFHCGTHFPGNDGHLCDEDYWLNIFKAKAASDALVRDTIADWAKQKIATAYTSEGLHRPKLGHVEVKTLSR